MIRGILFDKDGTLLDCDRLWIKASREVVTALGAKYGFGETLAELLLHAIGIQGNRVLLEGAVASGTNTDIANMFYSVLTKAGMQIQKETFIERTLNLYEKRMLTPEAEIVPSAPGLPEAFARLKRAGYRLGLATSDTLPSARYGMQRLELDAYLDFWGADDGVFPKKPAPDIIHAFCEQFSLRPCEVLMVGDTVNDMRFARGAGSACCGVLTGAGNAQELLSEADFLAPDATRLTSLL